MAKKPKSTADSKAKLVPRLGPPVNLRPGGKHKDKRERTRMEEKRAALMEDVGPAPPSRLEDEGR